MSYLDDDELGEDIDVEIFEQTWGFCYNLQQTKNDIELE